jgi:hypothetical protein
VHREPSQDALPLDLGVADEDESDLILEER